MFQLESLGAKFDDVKESCKPISLLIGADVAGKLYTGKIHQIQKGPTAIETKLGWTLMGKSNFDVPREDPTFLIFSMFDCEADVSDLWKLDLLGIEDPAGTVSKELKLEKVKEKFLRSIVFVQQDSRYEVALPWKDNHAPLIGNRFLAEKILETVTKRLISESLFEVYDEVFQEWLREGIIEVVADDLNDKSYYLQHRHGVKENSTTRVRPVFDASAATKNAPSLNQCLETGPNLIELIPSILMRFRENKIGATADIKKAFLQVSITPSDRNVLKFLWWDKSEPRKIIVYRHRRVVFGVNSSPFLLGATIEYHLETMYSSVDSDKQHKLLNILKRSFYVDNCVTSLRDESESIDFQNFAVSVMNRAGFLLRDWEFTGDRHNSVCSILGIIWNKQSDTLSLVIEPTDYSNKAITKRIILSAAHKIFDPLGCASPTLLRPKLVLQKL